MIRLEPVSAPRRFRLTNRPPYRRRRLAPRLESIEGRVVLSTITVTSAALGGDGGMGTTAGLDGTGQGGGVHLVTPGSTMRRSTIVGNKASTGDDNLFGSFS